MSDGGYDKAVNAIDRLARVLAVLYVHYLGDAELGMKAEHLNRCGFSNTEIAQILGSTPNSIGVALHHARQQRPKKQAKQKSRTKGKK